MSHPFHRPVPVLVFMSTFVLATVAAQAQGTSSGGATPAAATKTDTDAGRELFTAHCVRCHGADAKGTAKAPNLRQRVAGMSEAGFSSAVLQRYRWSLPATAAAGESGARDAMLRGMLSHRERGDKDMPAWQSQPEVAQGVKSLYTWIASLPR